MPNDLPPDEQELEVEADEVIDTVPDADDESQKQDSQNQDTEITKKRLKDTQAALTRKSQEFAELKGKLDLILQQQAQSQQKQEPSKPENPFGFLDDEAEVEKLLEDPKNVAGAFKKALGGLSQILEQRDKHLVAEMSKKFSSVATDEGREVAAKVARMREDSEYDGFTDEQLSVLARKSLKAQKAKQDKFRGGTGGSGGGARIQDGADPEREKEIDFYFRKLYGNSLDEPAKK